MALEKRKPTGREKDQQAVENLESLRQKLYCNNVSMARRNAYVLSWMQEDGLEILEEALLSSACRSTKTAAAYGLRSMRGRMKKPALEILTIGTDSQNKTTREVCKHALNLIANKSRKNKQKLQKA